MGVGEMNGIYNNPSYTTTGNITGKNLIGHHHSHNIKYIGIYNIDGLKSYRDLLCTSNAFLPYIPARCISARVGAYMHTAYRVRTIYHRGIPRRGPHGYQYHMRTSFGTLNIFMLALSYMLVLVIQTLL